MPSRNAIHTTERARRPPRWTGFSNATRDCRQEQKPVDRHGPQRHARGVYPACPRPEGQPPSGARRRRTQPSTPRPRHNRTAPTPQGQSHENRPYQGSSSSLTKAHRPAISPRDLDRSQPKLRAHGPCGLVVHFRRAPCRIRTDDLRITSCRILVRGCPQASTRTAACLFNGRFGRRRTCEDARGSS